MKNKILTLSFLTIICSITLFYSCKKKKNDETLTPDYAIGNVNAVAVPYAPVDACPLSYLTSSISITTGAHPFLVFSNRGNFDYIRDELLTLNGVYEVPDILQDSVSFDPILEKFENQFSGYYSLREKIVDLVDSLSDANVYDPTTFDPEDHFIGDVIYRTVLNDIMEVQINETVYKVMSDEWVATFSSGDPMALAFVRGYNINDLYGKIHDTTISNVLFTYTGAEYDLDPSTGLITGPYEPQCWVDITINENSGGEIVVSNLAGLSSPCLGIATIDWGDGSSPDVFGTTGLYSRYHTYATNGDYIVKVTFECSCGKPTTNWFEVAVTTASSSSCSSFPTADFTFDISKAGVLKVNSTTTSGSYKYYWKIASPLRELDNLTSTEFITNWNKPITVDVCLKIYNNSGCVSTKCSTINVPDGCCQRGGVHQWDHLNYATDHYIKCKMYKWNGGPLGRNVGAKTVNFEKRYRKFHLSRNPNKHWKRTNAEVSVILSGSIWSGNYTQEHTPLMYGPCYQEFSVSKSEYKLSKHNADVTYNPGPLISDNHRIYTKKHILSASHSVKHGGVSYNLMEYIDCP